MAKQSEIGLYRERRKRIKKLNLTSDLFSSVVFEDKLALQDVLRILTGVPNLKVIEAEPQKNFRNLYGHGMVSDVWAEDEDRVQYNMEIQMSENENHLKRSRFIQGRIDSRTLDTGRKYEELPELYMVFITGRDFLGVKTGVTTVVRKIEGVERLPDNGVHEIYANLENPAEDEEQRCLLEYIRNTDDRKVSTAGFCHLVERVRYLKCSEEGMRYMCELVEWERAEGRKEGRVEGKAEGKAEIILEFLAENGKISGKLAERIRNEMDVVLLGRWVHLAARVNSIAEFERQMK